MELGGMNSISIHYYKSPIGELILGSFEDQLCIADWRYRNMRNTVDKRLQTALSAEYVEQETTITQEAKCQLEAYFKKERTQFELPILMIGTDFQKRVWNELLKIPFGKTFSYLDLAKKIGDVGAVRAVASANGANALSIIVPCHRIIGSDGQLTGYAGGLKAKKHLLQLEGALPHQQLELF